MFAMCDRDTPTRSASSSCLSPSSSSSARNASASSIGLRSSRWMFSISASRRMSASSESRSTTGTVASPACFAARSRRSPAISSYAASPALRTTIGWRIPTSRIEAASDAMLLVVKCVRGCFGFGATALTGTSSSPLASSPASGAPGISADSPRPSPPRFDITRLPCGTVAIGASAARRHPRASRRCRLPPVRFGLGAASGRGRTRRLGGRHVVRGVLVDDHHPSFGEVPGWGGGTGRRDAGWASGGSSTSSHTSSSSADGRRGGVADRLRERGRLLELARFGLLGDQLAGLGCLRGVEVERCRFRSLLQLRSLDRRRRPRR